MKRQLVLVAHNLRSTHNVGSLLRTSDGLGVKKVYLSGYTPYPKSATDSRLPHLAEKINRQIAKTALGAEESSSWQQISSIDELLLGLRAQGYTLIALEQAPNAVAIDGYDPVDKMALIVGPEVDGLDKGVLAQVDTILEIPMHGKKESLNVSVAAAIALYQLLINRH